MIKALHAMVLAEDAEAARAFFRDVLEYPGVDTGGGWLIFKTGPSELGVHPSSGEYASTGARFDVSLVCDNLEKTMAELTAKGAEFIGDVQDLDWGITAQLRVPGAGQIMLYQPKYDPPATSL